MGSSGLLVPGEVADFHRGHLKVLARTVEELEFPASVSKSAQLELIVADRQVLLPWFSERRQGRPSLLDRFAA